MAVGPTPSEIFERAVNEGERRLDQSLLALVSNGFIAGFTIVFGIIVLGIVQAGIEPLSQGLARIAGAGGFGIGLVFLLVGFVLALGPFDHVIVTDLHLLFGLFLGGEIGVGSLVWTTVISAGGNLVGGLGFVTLTHVEEARGEH